MTFQVEPPSRLSQPSFRTETLPIQTSSVQNTHSTLESLEKEDSDPASPDPAFHGVWTRVSHFWTAFIQFLFGAPEPAEILQKFQERAEANLLKLIDLSQFSNDAPIKASAVVKLNGRIIASHYTSINASELRQFLKEITEKAKRALSGEKPESSDELTVSSTSVQYSSPDWKLSAAKITEKDTTFFHNGSSTKASMATSRKALIERISSQCEGDEANKKTEIELLKFFLPN